MHHVLKSHSFANVGNMFMCISYHTEVRSLQLFTFRIIAPYMALIYCLYKASDNVLARKIQFFFLSPIYEFRNWLNYH